MQPALVEMAKGFYQDEINDHLTYQELVGDTRKTEFDADMRRIALMERRHAEFWKAMLEAQQVTLPFVRVNRMRLWILRLLRLIINPVLLVSLLELGETSAVKRYLYFFNHADLDEREKTRLKQIILDELEHETYFKQTAQSLGVGNLRDFVLGMNDGLVEILGAVTGLSAVYPNQPLLVAVSGLIVGIAGALSMGIGAFVSVRSQRQVNDGMRERMEALLAIDPLRAVRTYQGELMASGIPAPLAEETARTLGKNQGALTNLILPDNNGDNELHSALFTGGAYLISVIFPVLPYFFVSVSLLALPFSILLAGLSLTVVASLVAMLSGIPIKVKALEMVVSGFAAAALSYGFGSLMRSVCGLGE
jgi:VIT1/CCC1 family predicted Fe2+/Mn2+ transporter